MNDEVYYLDTSALVKRYVSELGSDVVDEIFSNAYRGLNVLAFSYWNIAEAAVVFDEYGRRLGLNARNLLRNLLREARTLAKLNRVIIVRISPSIIREVVKLVLKHHIYAADALQVVSAVKSSSTKFVTGIRDLADVAKVEGLKTLYLG